MCHSRKVYQESLWDEESYGYVSLAQRTSERGREGTSGDVCPSPLSCANWMHSTTKIRGPFSLPADQAPGYLTSSLWVKSMTPCGFWWGSLSRYDEASPTICVSSHRLLCRCCCISRWLLARHIGKKQSFSVLEFFFFYLKLSHFYVNSLSNFQTPKMFYQFDLEGTSFGGWLASGHAVSQDLPLTVPLGILFQVESSLSSL